MSRYQLGSSNSKARRPREIRLGTSAKLFESNNRAEMRVSVEYYDGEPREALKLHQEEWGIISCPEKRIAPSRERSAVDRLVKSMKKEAAQDNLNHAKLGDEELSNTLQFKYLGVMQAADGDPLAPVFTVWKSRGLVYKSEVHLDSIQGIKKSQTTSVPSLSDINSAIRL